MSKVNKILVSSTQHPISKLRLFKLDESQYTRSSLSARERLLLEKRAALQTWNHDYWCENNSEFQKVCRSKNTVGWMTESMFVFFRERKASFNHS